MNRIIHSLPLLGLALLGACAQAQLEVPTKLADHRVEVARDGRQLRIGEFAIQATPTHNDVRRATIGGLFQEEHVATTYRFGFALAVGGQVEDEVACARDSREDFHSNGVVEVARASHRLRCVLSGANGRERGTLALSGHEGIHHLRGGLVRDALTLEVVPAAYPDMVDPLTADAFAPVGYELRLGGVQVGAVQTRDGEQVWMDPRAPAWLRKYVALAAAVLILHGDSR